MLLLEDLKKRLETIKEANNYPLTIKKVSYVPAIDIEYISHELPLIEIILGDEEYLQKAQGNLECTQEMILRLVASKHFSDDEMLKFKSAVIRCIFSNSYSNQGNSGSQAFGTSDILQPKLVACVSDLNMLNANRIWNLVFKFKYVTHTYMI